MKMTEQEFFDYIRCPAFYDMKNIRQISLEGEASYKELLETVSRSFFMRMLEEKIMPISELKRKWDKVCEKHEDMLSTKQIMEGMSMLMKFYNWMEREQIGILDTGSKYSLLVDGIEISGEGGVIASDRKGGYELLIPDFGSKVQDQTIADMKLKYTLQSYAFEKSNRKMLRGIRIHSVKFDKDVYTDRGQDDYKRLESAIIGVGKSLENDLFYPREGMCSTCPGKIFCRYWSR